MKYADESETVGPRGWTDWIFPRRGGYRMMCCDCGLVHELQFRLRGRHIEFRARLHKTRNGRRSTQVASCRFYVGGNVMGMRDWLESWFRQESQTCDCEWITPDDLCGPEVLWSRSGHCFLHGDEMHRPDTVDGAEEA